MSTVLLIIMAGWILYVQPDFDSIVLPLWLTVATISIFFFLQGLLALLMRGQNIASSMVDIVMSIAALIAMSFLLLLSDKSEITLWWLFYTLFAFPVIYDVLINNGMLLKLLGLSNAVTSER